MPTQLADVTVSVNNETIGIVPNSLKFSEGLGEQSMHPVSEGGGAVSVVFANDLETAFSRVSFDVRTTIENIALLREWKLNGDANVVTIGAAADGLNLSKVFNGSALIGDYDVEIGADTTITADFQSAAAA